MAFDAVILNGTVIDGTDRPAYRADIGIAAGKIAAVADLGQSEAAVRIDATGHVVAPGFIDMHSHSDVTMLDDPRGESKAYQGVTTEVTGNCGTTPFPSGIYSGPELRRQRPIHPLPESPTDWPWTTLDGWADHMESAGFALNVAPQVGHTTLKHAVGAPLDRPATSDEIRHMQRLAAESVDQGAVAVTNGLTGVQFANAPTEEIVALVKAVAPYENAFYATHARLGTGQHFKAVEEAVEIGRRAGIAVEFSHIAVTDSNYHGRAAEMVDIIERARDGGLDITYDVYPYTAAGVGLTSMVPAWLEAGGAEATQAKLLDPPLRARAKRELGDGTPGSGPWRWEGIVISKVSARGDLYHVGRSVAQIAESRNADPLDTLLDLIVEDGNIECVFHNRREDDVRYFVTHALSMIGTDGMAISPEGIWSKTKIHPRFYGTYPKILGRYVREEGLLSLETAVHKMSGYPAQRLGLRDRGRVEEGLVADLVVFDPEKVIDVATWEDPHRYPAGIPYVFVNGQALISEGRHTGTLPGRVLRRGS